MVGEAACTAELVICSLRKVVSSHKARLSYTGLSLELLQ